MHITCPSLVQIEVIPLALQGKDILVNSKTGSGKTLAYLIPLVQKLLSNSTSTTTLLSSTSSKSKKQRLTTTTTKSSSSSSSSRSGVRAIILVPTRELCDQIETVLYHLLHFCSDVIFVASLGKGTMETRKARLEEYPDIVIATPGRLVEHLMENEMLLKDSVESLIVDEADMVLAYGNADDIKTIIDRIPTTCQCMLMSATLDDDIKQLKRLVLKDPVTVKLRDDVNDFLSTTTATGTTGTTTTTTLTQWCVLLKNDDKDLVIYALLKLSLINPGKALFFVNTIDRGYRLKIFLEQFGIKCAVLNSELPANSRRHILDAFDKGAFDYLIATDEAIDSVMEQQQQPTTTSTIQSSNNQQSNKSLNKQRSSSSSSNNNPLTTTTLFSVSRGIDFRGVQTVINVDLPSDAKSYIHRIGRTARAGASGTALSLVDETSELALLNEIKTNQPPARDGQPQPVPLSIDLSELEGFRYRVDDMRRSITKRVVSEARIRDLKNEILNSERLQSHFKENPVDLRLLKHDAPIRRIKAQPHLKHVPTYLVPEHQQQQQQSNYTSNSSSVVNEIGQDGIDSNHTATSLDGPLPRTITKKERGKQYMKEKRAKRTAVSKAKRRKMSDPLAR
jgi:ATP-dependent RNA helicase DDX56/DBP9